MSIISATATSCSNLLNTTIEFNRRHSLAWPFSGEIASCNIHMLQAGFLCDQVPQVARGIHHTHCRLA